ncbi:hypothetical protein XFF6166_1060010 [Xanthomonas citri pv. fuscans]|nr:Hypothetical protein XFF4834R_chr19370 [Xanthomonas citri pv. fuscans]SON75367.1 hypothetical protein XFF6166_1060010 [Xanthomonas citri pv. fuscans]SON98334.1 hypothetical protein XFF7767_1020034 [Xanthomonas citri pv. fuscans]SOO04103.1 hypothetical protein XFF6960_930033 [Xanthomonas citri pv. fuscans]SOO41830.1 hypothetical protein XFF1815_1000009 [Xanthomonas citri pv. fuscans]
MQAMRFALATLSFAGRQLLLQSKLRVVAGRGFVQQRQALGFTSTRIRSRSQSLSTCSVCRRSTAASQKDAPAKARGAL